MKLPNILPMLKPPNVIKSKLTYSLCSYLKFTTYNKFNTNCYKKIVLMQSIKNVNFILNKCMQKLTDLYYNYYVHA